MSYIKVTTRNAISIKIEFLTGDYTTDYISDVFRKGDVSQIKRGREDDCVDIYFSSSLEHEIHFDVLNEIDGVTYATNIAFYEALCTLIFGA